MAKEVKTVLCYPNNEIIDAAIKRYGAFGWELSDNRRCREDGVYVVSTFNRLTFSRDNGAPWYNEVTELERTYDELMDREPALNTGIPSRGWLICGIIGLAVGAALWLVLDGIICSFFEIYTLLPALVIMCVGAVLFTIYIVKHKKFNKAYSDYCTSKKTWESTSKSEAEELLAKAEAIVSGN